MWCSQCGLEIELAQDAAGPVWLTLEGKTAVTRPVRAVCSAKNGIRAPWRHAPVETQEEVLLEWLLTGPGLNDEQTVDDRLRDLAREWERPGQGRGPYVRRPR